MKYAVEIKLSDWRSSGGAIMQTLDALYDHDYKIKFKMKHGFAENIWAIVPNNESILVVLILTLGKSIICVERSTVNE